MSNQTTFSDAGIDPLIATEIMDLLGISQGDLKLSNTLDRLIDVIEHFQGEKNYRGNILRVLDKHYGGEPLQRVWEYVQLTQERAREIKELPKEEFAKDIQDEIEERYLTKENMEKIKKDIVKHKKDIKINEDYIGLTQKAYKASREISDKSRQEKLEKLQTIEKKINKIDSLNKQIDKYQ